MSERVAKIEQKIDDMSIDITTQMQSLAHKIDNITDKIVLDFKEIAILKRNYEECPARKYVQFPNMRQLKMASFGLIAAVIGSVLAYALPKVFG